MPAGQGEVGGGGCGAELGLVVIVSHHLRYLDVLYVHKWGQFLQVVHILNLPSKLCTNDWFEEVVDNSDQTCWMDNVTIL